MQSKLIATAIGGVGLGALVGWAVTADYYEQKLKIRDQHLDRLWALHSNTAQELRNVVKPWTGTIKNNSSSDKVVEVGDAQPIEEINEESEPENPPEQNSGETAVTDDEEEVDESTIQERRSHLQDIISQYAANPEDRDEFVNQASALVNSNDPPFVIDRGTYSSDEEGEYYEKTTVTYYPSSRVLLDEDDEVIDEPGQVIGWRNLSRFGDESGDPDVVFVRNRKLSTDYEVVKDEDSPLPTHVKYGLGREEFNVAKASGTLRLRDEDT